jgi:hypothetical protein
LGFRRKGSRVGDDKPRVPERVEVVILIADGEGRALGARDSFRTGKRHLDAFVAEEDPSHLEDQPPQKKDEGEAAEDEGQTAALFGSPGRYGPG